MEIIVGIHNKRNKLDGDGGGNKKSEILFGQKRTPRLNESEDKQMETKEVNRERKNSTNNCCDEVIFKLVYCENTWMQKRRKKKPALNRF